jgi:hypothetical protein
VTPGGREDEVSSRRDVPVASSLVPTMPAREGNRMGKKFRAWLGKLLDARRRRTDDAFRRGTSTPV